MNNLRKAATLTLVVGGLVAAGAGAASSASGAHGGTVRSPGVGSGNLVQVPVHVPVGVSGTSVNVIGLLNPAFGSTALGH